MITKSLVPNNERLEFLPKHLGSHFFRFENLVYSFMDHFCENYSGGYWNYYNLSNGGILMSHDYKKNYYVTNPINYFEGIMSAEAVSIGINMFAMNALIENAYDESLIDLYYALRDFGSEHEEAAAILRFID